jgi:protein-disulfide isomerase
MHFGLPLMEKKMNIRRSLKGTGLLLGLFFLLSVAFVACGPATSNTETSESSRKTNTDIGNEDADQEEGSEVRNTPTDSNDQSDDQLVNNPENTTGGLDIDPSTTETDEFGLIVGFTTDGHPFRGDPNAPVIIKEYSDYQCPFCSRFYDETLPAIEENQLANGDAVLVYYDFPLNNIHPQASAAANAARCAGEQSATTYWSMHNALYEGLSQWSNSNAKVIFSGYAEGIGLDVDKFEVCIAESKYEKPLRTILIPVLLWAFLELQASSSMANC